MLSKNTQTVKGKKIKLPVLYTPSTYNEVPQVLSSPNEVDGKNMKQKQKINWNKSDKNVAAN